MHQSVGDQGAVASEHLQEEWRLFQAFEAGADGHLCRTWEVTRPVVVVGRNTSIAEHVVLDACGEDGVPVLRRFSGGGAVVLATGSLNYALAVSLISHPALADVGVSFDTILRRIATALDLPGLAMAGDTDLALNGRKVSGNAQRRGCRALIHHGTLLYAFDSRLATRYLREPIRRPAYRAMRRHIDFLGNLPLSKQAIETRLATAWPLLGGPSRTGR